LPAIKKVIDDVKYQVSKKGTVTLLDGREVPCRSEHSALNVQLQGDGAIVMKLAQVLLNRKIAKLNARFMATVHDEWQLECEPSIADTVGQMAVDSIQEAGEKLKCMQLDGEFRVGKDWSETH
jgi:DNA polymerase I-like protein with 3'-5' exonuclease and polymerase domains